MLRVVMASMKVMLFLTYASRPPPDMDSLFFLVAEYPGKSGVLFEAVSFVSWMVITAMLSWLRSCCSSALLFWMPFTLI